MAGPMSRRDAQPPSDRAADLSCRSADPTCHSERSEESTAPPPGARRYAIQHVSHYRYTAPVRHSVMSLCLQPRHGQGQRLLHFALDTDPPAHLSAETDAYGNAKHVFSVHQQHDALKITARSTVATVPAAPLPAALSAGAWDEIHAQRDSFAHWDFTHESPFARSSPALTAFAARHGIAPAGDPLGSLCRLSETLHAVFAYVPGSTSAASPIEHILETGRGVCQDYAHVMIAIARSWGVPTRYVSGYVHVNGGEDAHAPPQSQTQASSQAQAQSQTQAPQTATHAWVECLLPGLGWVGFDPTNRALANARHVAIAAGRDYDDVSPSRGVLQGVSGSWLEVDVRMSLLEETPK